MKKTIQIGLLVLLIILLAGTVLQQAAAYNSHTTKAEAVAIKKDTLYDLDSNDVVYWFYFVTPGTPCETRIDMRGWYMSFPYDNGTVYTVYQVENASGKVLFKVGGESFDDYVFKETLEPNTKYYLHIYAEEGYKPCKDKVCGYRFKLSFKSDTIPLDSSFSFTLSKTEVPYTGKAIKPAVTLKDSDGKTLTKGTDYKVTYKNHTDAGTATVTVTGTGLYSGTLKKTFKILPAELTSIKLKKAEYDYTGKAIKPAATVKAKVNGKTVTLTQDTDYKLTYVKNKATGTATVKAAGKGNFTGTVKATFKIKPVKIASVTAAGTAVYNGKALTPAVTVTAKVNGKTVTLTKDTDYTVTYADNKAIGTASITVTGKGNFKGSAGCTFTIIPGVPKLTVKSSKSETAKLSVKAVKGASGYEFHYQKADSNKSRLVLTPKKTCEITGLENKKEYLFKVRAYGTTASGETVFGDFSDTVKVTIDAGKDISEGKMTIGKKNDIYTYTGSEIKPTIKIKCDLSTLKEGTDYILSFNNNVNAGTATVTATGIGDYSGELKGTFVIDRASMLYVAVSFSKNAYTYTGSAIKPKISTLYCGKSLVKGTDYKVTFEDNKNAGTAHVIIEGMGNFKDGIGKSFTIDPLPLNECEVTLPDGEFYGYTGKTIEPAVLVKHGKTAIPMNDKTYKVSYKNNIDGGKAKAIVKGTGNLTGSITLEFEITMLRVTVGAHQDYTTRYVNRKIQESPYKEGLENGKVVIFMFEGCGSNSSTQARSNATCVVVRNGDDGLEIAFELPSCSSIPDNPLNAKLNWSQTKSDYGPVPTVKDGSYSFTYVNHHGEYAALNVTNARVVRFDNDKSNWSKWDYTGSDSWLEGVRDYKNTSSAINVHHRHSAWSTTSRSSTGCFLISQQTSGFSKNCDYWNFLVAVGRIRDTTSGINLAPESAPGKGGWIIVDRSQARDYLKNIYGNDTAVRRILGEE